MPENRFLRRTDGWSKESIGHFCEDSARTQGERRAGRVCLPWTSAVQLHLMGGCLVCWHEVMGLCVETATLLMTAAGTERRGEERKEDQAAEAPAAWWQACLLRAQSQCQATWWPRYVDLCLPPLVSGTYCPTRTIDQESAGRDSDPHGHHLHKYYLQLSLLISQNLGCLSSKMRLLGQILPS